MNKFSCRYNTCIDRWGEMDDIDNQHMYMRKKMITGGMKFKLLMMIVNGLIIIFIIMEGKTIFQMILPD